MGRQPCCEKVGLKRGPWTADEDRKLINFILTNGHCSWRALPKLAGLLRCGKSCRLRWTNYLRPDLKRGLLSESEEQLVINLHSKLGNRWSKIASHLPGRTDNEIKNHWNTHIKKKLRKMGIDPVTHRPIPPPPPNSDHHQELLEEEQSKINFSIPSAPVPPPDDDRDRDHDHDMINCITTDSSVSTESSADAPLIISNNFCTGEVPMMETEEVLLLTNNIHKASRNVYGSSISSSSSSSGTTSTSSSTCSSSSTTGGATSTVGFLQLPQDDYFDWLESMSTICLCEMDRYI